MQRAISNLSIVIMRNARTSVSHNAIVDVRRRRREIFFSMSENTMASNFKIYRNVALDSLYISTGNDVIIYFQSAPNRINVFILGQIRVAVSR